MRLPYSLVYCWSAFLIAVFPMVSSGRDTEDCPVGMVISVKGQVWKILRRPILSTGPDQDGSSSLDELCLPVQLMVQARWIDQSVMRVGEELCIGDAIKTGPNGRAVILVARGAEIQIPSKTCLIINQTMAERKPSLLQQVGRFLYKFLPMETQVILESPRGVIGIEGTEFTQVTRQRIAFVPDNDLWLMYEDGTERTRYITAPPGCRIGRSTFSRDGSKVVYEVWGSAETLCHLYVADGNGANPQVLVSAGSLGADTGIENYTYLARRNTGPSFSPDGSRICFQRIQEYKRNNFSLRKKELCTVPVSGGGASVVWKTLELPGLYTDYDRGENTSWLNNGNIAFIRSGKIGTRFSAIVNATDTNRTAWPCELYLEWDNENSLNPILLKATVDGQTLNCLESFKGFGEMHLAGTNWNWMAFPESSGWQTPQAGAWYGPIKSHDLTAGSKSILLASSDGHRGINSQSFPLVVTTGSVATYDVHGNFYYQTDEGGVWLINSAGGTPWQLTRQLADSMAWNGSNTLFVTDYENFGVDTQLLLHDAEGRTLGNASLGSGMQSSLGNWDVTDRQCVSWCGSTGTGQIRVFDFDTLTFTDLGAGSYPVFTPFFRTEISVSEGRVWVADETGGNRQTFGPGQTCILDSLANQGHPQTPIVTPGPYVTNVIPSWGSAVSTNSPIALTLRFTRPMSTNHTGECEMTAATWPAATGMAQKDLEQNALLYALALRNESTGTGFSDTIAALQNRGIGLGVWNESKTEYTFTINPAAFPRLAGNCCRLSLDVSGLSSAGGIPLGFGQGLTAFAWVDPMSTNGGSVQTEAGGKLTVPAHALATSAALGADVASRLPDRLPEPTNRIALSAYYTFTPTNQILTTNATVSLPLAGGYPSATLWCFNGSSWTNLGGTYDPAAGMISAPTRTLGTFVVLYSPPSNVFLRLTKTAYRSIAGTNELIPYTLILQNLGLSTATGTVVTDTLPIPLLNYVANSVSSNGVYTPGTHTLAWSLGTVGPGETVRMSFEAAVGSGAPYAGLLTNVAFATCSQAVSTSSLPALVRIAGTPASGLRFGIADTNNVNPTNLVALAASYRRGTVEITASQFENTNLLPLAAFDAQVRTNQSRGYRTYAVVNGIPEEGQWPSVAAFAQAIGVYVQRYNGDGIGDMPGLTLPVRQWEIFDEFDPDSGRWAGCSLDLYYGYLSAASAVAHTIDPDIEILCGSFRNMPPTGTNYLTSLFSTYPDTLGAIDACSVHEGWDLTNYWTGIAWLPDYLQAIALSEALPDREIWFSQADFTDTYTARKNKGFTCTDTDNALFLAHAFPFALGAGIDHVFYSRLEAKASEGEAVQWAALIDTNGHRRIAFYVYQKMIRTLENASRFNLRDLADGNLAVQAINASNQSVWVVWNLSNRTSQVSLPMGPVAQAQVTRALPLTFNNTTATWSVSFVNVANGVALIPVSGTSVYVEAVGQIEADLDGDGIPNDLDSDLDGDGLPNEWELEHALNPFSEDAAEDLDGDGASNLQEYLAGTDPQERSSAFVCQRLAVTGMPFRVEWQSVSGQTYRIEWTEALSNGWSAAQDGILTATGAVTRWTDTGPPKTGSLPTTQTKRFYRILIVP